MSADRILIVDDNLMNLQVTRLLLTAEGFEIQTATDSQGALAAIATSRPHLILMDIQLPGMDGLELTRVLKSNPETRDIVIVALTAYAMKGDEERSRSAGCDGYVTKPIDTRTLPAQVRKYLGSAQFPQPIAPGSDFQDLLADLRTTFLSEGEDEIWLLLDALKTSFDPAEAERACHRWAGMAGTLGFSEIGRKARALESVLRGPGADMPRMVITPEFCNGFRLDLLELLKMFSDAARGKREAPPLSAGPESPLMVGSVQSLNDAIGGPDAAMDSAAPPASQRFKNPLPEVSPQAMQSQPAAKIIIADDDPWVTKLLSATLLRFGVECVIATNGRQALELTKSILPDVLVLDVRMPELDGFEVLFSLKRDEATKHVKVIMLTADDQKTDMIRGYGYGADEYVTKPFDAIELAGRILRRLPTPSPTLTTVSHG